MIEISEVTYGYDEKTIFNKFSFSIKKGEFLMVLGKGGSRKSTLARLIKGIDLPAVGKILIEKLY